MSENEVQSIAQAAPVPKVTRQKWPTQADVARFFGRIELGNDGRPTERWEARSLTTVLVPYQLRLAWEPATVVRKLTCHRLVSQSLTQCLAAVLELYGSAAAVRAAGMDLYGGCYNFRPMRGGHLLSMHSYGIAIDLDPENNPLGEPSAELKQKPEARGQKPVKGAATMPLEVVAIFEAAGWTWGGRWSGRPDCMHFQAASV